MARASKSAGGVVVNGDGYILVVSQKGTSWSLPKGHIEDGEDPLAAAKREIYEESGIKNLTLVKRLPSYKRFKISLSGGDDMSEQKTIHMFLFMTTDKDLSPLDPDNPEARWLSKKDVTSILTHPKDKEFFQDVSFELENI